MSTWRCCTGCRCDQGQIDFDDLMAVEWSEDEPVRCDCGQPREDDTPALRINILLKEVAALRAAQKDTA